MSLATFAIRRPLAVWAVSLGLVAIGLLALGRMPVALFPQVELPFVTIRVAQAGADPDYLETAVVRPVEREFAKVPGVTRQITFVRPGVVEFVVGFRFGQRSLESVSAARAALDRVRSAMPAGLGPFDVRAVDPASTPVLVEALPRVFAESGGAMAEQLSARIKGLPGVASVEILGLPQQKTWLRLSRDALFVRKIPPLLVWQNMAAQSLVAPWGVASVARHNQVQERGDVATRVPLSAQIPLEARAKPESVLHGPGGVLVPLADLGEFRVEPDAEAPRVFIGGEPSLTLSVYRRLDSSAVDVVQRVRAALDEWQDKQLSPHDAAGRLTAVLNQADYIRESAREVWLALLWGGLFAMLTVALALGDVRSALITGTALPISVCATFLVVAWLGYSLNTLTLLALSLAIGLLIDDAIIVRESIIREQERGRTPLAAAIEGTARVFGPVMATTFCVVAVFLPVAFMQGVVGQFFREFAITVCVAMMFSALVAFTMDPMLSARFSRPSFAAVHKNSPWIRRMRSARRSGMRWLLGLVDMSFRRSIWTVTLSLVLFLWASWLASKGGLDFLTSEDKAQLLIEVVGDPGEGGRGLDERVRQISQLVRSVPETERTVAFVATGNDPFRASIRVLLSPKKKRARSHLEVASELRAVLDRAGARVLVREPPPLEGVGGEPPLSLYIYGNSQSELLSAANQIRTKLAAVPGTGSVVVDTAGLLEGVTFDVDMALVARYGADPRSVFLTGQMVGWGLPVAGAVGAGPSGLGSSAPVSGADAGASGLWLGFDSAGGPMAGAAPQGPGFVAAGHGAQALALFDRVLVPGQQGPVELKSFLSPQVTRRPFAIDREGQMRKVVLYGAADGSVALSKVLDGWQRVAEVEGAVSPALRFEVAGDRAMLDEMADSFSLAMLGGVLCVLVALVVLFENLWMPVMVVASLPLAAAGGLLGLAAAGERLAMGSMIGFVLLLGLSAKNAILLVDGIKKYSDRRPLAQRLVVLLAVKNRVRPILMTSFALGVGMLPTIFLRGAGSEFRSPMALCIVSGLVSSTALSFFVIPALCGLFLRRRAARSVAKQARL